MNLSYNQLQSIIPSDELHYVEDCGQFMEDNEYDLKDYAQYEYIIFSETTDHLPSTLEKLMTSHVPFTVQYDEFNYEFILI